MYTLDLHDIRAIQHEAREDWEFRHHDAACPFTEEIGEVEVDDAELAWELDSERRLSAWA